MTLESHPISEVGRTTIDLNGDYFNVCGMAGDRYVLIDRRIDGAVNKAYIHALEDGCEVLEDCILLGSVNRVHYFLEDP
jgi:hypothetical protein